MQSTSSYAVLLFIFSLAVSCKSINKAQKGGVFGTAGGGIIGSVIGQASGNTEVGTMIGSTVGGVTGAVIGTKMDNQADDIKHELPGVKVERVGEGIVVEFKSNVLFGIDRSDLAAAATKNLDDLAGVLNKYPDTNIEIRGYTDNRGHETYNQALSERRANAVSAYLKQKDIAAARIITKGFGESSPKYSNSDDAGRSENRRVEFLISANEKMKEESKQEAGK